MILNLVLKDIKVHWKTIFIWYLFWLVMDSLIITTIDNESWIPYISIGCVQISLLIGIYFFQERMSKRELFTGSLPVTRQAIIHSKYITSACIALTGLMLGYLNATALNTIFKSAPPDYYLFQSPYVILIVMLYFSLLVSLFLPIAACYSGIWIKILLAYACILIFINYVKGFRYLVSRINLNAAIYDSGSIIFIAGIFILISLALFISVNRSVKIYAGRDF